MDRGPALREALLASRSAITGAVKLLEPMRLLNRTRRPGERVDRISASLAALEPQSFDSGLFSEQAVLFREGLALLPRTPGPAAPPSRREWRWPSSSTSGSRRSPPNGASAVPPCEPPVSSPTPAAPALGRHG
jgi:hypothetical protein